MAGEQSRSGTATAAPAPAAPRARPARETARRALACLALVPAVVLLGVRSYQAVDRTRRLVAPAATAAADGAERQFECLEDSLRSAVPAGSEVFLDISDSLWYQRAAAAAFPDRRVVAAEGEADVVVRLRAPGAPAPCADGGVEAYPPRAGP